MTDNYIHRGMLELLKVDRFKRDGLVKGRRDRWLYVLKACVCYVFWLVRDEHIYTQSEYVTPPYMVEGPVVSRVLSTKNGNRYVTASWLEISPGFRGAWFIRIGTKRFRQ